MEVRRMNSTPLVDVGNEAYGIASPHSKMHGGRLPALWKSLKAKIGSLSTSRSANNLSSLATAAPDARASPSVSPSAQAIALCRERPLHAQGGPSHRPFFSTSSPEGALDRQDTSSMDVNAQQNDANYVSGDSSPAGVCTSHNALSACAGSSFGSAPSSVTTKAMNISELRSSPSPLPTAVAPHVDSFAPKKHPESVVIKEAATTPNRKLLAVSSALPSSMRRKVWALDDYLISRRIFKGSFSAVYKAVCRRSGMPVALKVYFLGRIPANVVHMLKREIEIHIQLLHRHVVRLYAAFMDEGDRVVLVQEYATHGDLYNVVQRIGGRMPPEQVADGVMRPFLEALAYMHSKGVCHRDIKPENILFTQSWRLLVADYGVSIDLNQERAVTRAGTEGYMAPEVERCPLKTEPHENKDNPKYAYSTAVDIWAVGVLAYELMVGFPPVVMSTVPGNPAATSGGPNDDSVTGFVRSHMNSASLHFPASVPHVARAFVLAALAPDPLERPTAAQLLQHPWLRPMATVAPTVTVPEALPAPVGRSVGIASGGLRCEDMEDRFKPNAPAGTMAVVTGQRLLVSAGSPAASAICMPA
ncbi:hypothetical protein Vretimale_13767 [Volvox reticuliferus]|uniref:Protein kinase domain-containing protein n=1 Tax=Volvox reticuliferus TaxID=1737510 RepID=A0A8J4GN49_9CHLO|nr:hypothetical protein Vretifemale_14620 [Volvox reticuliferus]GIM09975.1 hypothetical protein Vretimale_13767 [Volvox reticuliferus]